MQCKTRNTIKIIHKYLVAPKRLGDAPIDVTPATPSDIGPTFLLTANTLAPNGFRWQDVVQGQLADCYFISPASEVARRFSQALQDRIHVFADGSCEVIFSKWSGTQWIQTNVHMSAELSTQYAQAGPDGSQWVRVLEKAWAYYRSPQQDKYSDENYGWMTEFFLSFGWKNYTTALSPTEFIAKWGAGWLLTMGTNGTITDGAPLEEAHAYSFAGCDANGCTLYNPWGFDGVDEDSDAGDGLVTMTWDQFAANSAGTVAVNPTDYVSPVVDPATTVLPTPTPQEPVMNPITITASGGTIAPSDWQNPQGTRLEPNGPNGTEDLGYMDGAGTASVPISVAAAGQYYLTATIASQGTGGTLALTLDGAALAPIPVTNTGAWNKYQDQTVGPVSLPAGQHTLAFGAHGINLATLAVSATAPVAPVAPTGPTPALPYITLHMSAGDEIFVMQK